MSKSKNITARSKIEVMTEWKEKHPYLYDLYRVCEDGIARHVNSIFKDYNDSGNPQPGFDSRMSKYVSCATSEEVERYIAQAHGQHKLHYFYTAIPRKDLATVVGIEIPEKSLEASMALKLMDSDLDCDYCSALKTVLREFPNIDKNALEEELNTYI